MSAAAPASPRVSHDGQARLSSALPAVPPGDVALRHGYTLSAVNGLAAAAVVVRDVFHQSLPFAERLETAWYAIVEHLYAAQEPPGSGELIRAAWKALRAQVEDEWRTHGIGRTAPIDGESTMVNFWRYWWPQARTTASPEDRVVDPARPRPDLAPAATDAATSAAGVGRARGLRPRGRRAEQAARLLHHAALAGAHRVLRVVTPRREAIRHVGAGQTPLRPQGSAPVGDNRRAPTDSQAQTRERGERRQRTNG